MHGQKAAPAKEGSATHSDTEVVKYTHLSEKVLCALYSTIVSESSLHSPNYYACVNNTLVYIHKVSTIV